MTGIEPLDEARLKIEGKRAAVPIIAKALCAHYHGKESSTACACSVDARYCFAERIYSWEAAAVVKTLAARGVDLSPLADRLGAVEAVARALKEETAE